MFEMIGMLAALGLVGWLVLVALFAASVAASEYERVEFLFFAAIVSSVVLYFWQGINVPLTLWANLGHVLTYSVTWLAIGTLWSFWKWDRHCARARASWDALYDSYKDKSAVPRWQDEVPRAIKAKRKFINWIILWPQSMFWYVFSDLIHDLVDLILRQLAHVYDAIARRHFKNMPGPIVDAPLQKQKRVAS